MSKKKAQKKVKVTSAQKKLRSEIKKRNAAFAKLKPTQKRVQIARDVLARLYDKRLEATNNVWTGIDDTQFFVPDQDVDGDIDVSEYLADKDTCNGCALGGLFICAVDRADELKLNSFLTEYEKNKDDNYCTADFKVIFKYLKKFFKEDQLKLIEYTFENGEGVFDTLKHEDRSAANSFIDFIVNTHDNDVEPATLMRLIMENIVVNKGVFKPNVNALKKEVVTVGYTW